MTSKGQITKIASTDGVDARVVERDYVLAHVVALISAHDADRTLVFKGGTSLRLLHFNAYRYSADLDYSVIKGSEEQARELIGGALARTLPETIKELGLDGDAIAYVGPLGAPRTIKLDLTDTELVVNTEERSLLRRWADTPECSVAAYTKLEVAAEKLRCVLQRRQCRDLLDLDLLLDEQDPVATADLFRRKATHRRLDPATFAEKFEKRVQDYKARWKSATICSSSLMNSSGAARRFFFHHASIVSASSTARGWNAMRTSRAQAPRRRANTSAAGMSSPRSAPSMRDRSSARCSGVRSQVSSSTGASSTSVPSGRSVGSSTTSLPFLTRALTVIMDEV